MAGPVNPNAPIIRADVLDEMQKVFRIDPITPKSDMSQVLYQAGQVHVVNWLISKVEKQARTQGGV